MGPPAVVVLDIGPQRPIEMPPTEDEGPVESLGPDRLDYPFGMGIRVGSLDRRADDPHPFRPEHRVERPTALGVPVSDEEPDTWCAAVEVHHEVARLLGDPRRVRMSGRRAEVDPPAPELDEHEDVQDRKSTRLNSSHANISYAVFC